MDCLSLLPSPIPFTLLSFFFLSSGQAEGHQGGSGLPLCCLSKSTGEQSVIIFQCWIWEVFALWTRVKPFVVWLESLVLTSFFHIIKRKTFESLPWFSPFIVIVSERWGPQKMVKKLKCTKQKSIKCLFWNKLIQLQHWATETRVQVERN